MSVFKRFPRTFWVANTMELFERWAFYGFYMLFANYLTASTEIGALGLSQIEKGIIMSVGTAILYFLPVITGAIADKYGFKKVLFAAYLVYIASFLIMPLCRSFTLVFLNYLFLAIGAALFKPIISATVAKTTDEKTSSIGFGIFYMMVNIGAFVGPIFALQFKKLGYDSIFYISAAIIALNLIILFFYKEPERDTKDESFGAAIKTIFLNIWQMIRDFKLLLFLIIVSGFWAMYFNLFAILPVFINQWIDTSTVLHFLQGFWPWLASHIVTEQGSIDAEYFTSIDALYIAIFQLIVSSAVAKWRPLNSMITGFIICSFGMGLTLYTNNGFFILLALLIFGLGEMAGSPKINEYIGRIAPRDKVALYMGSSFLPIFFGNILNGIVSGPVYQGMTDKITIVKKELTSMNISFPEFSDSFTKTDIINKACNELDLSGSELTMYLWDKYQPFNIAYVVIGIGITTALLLFLYDKLLLKKSE